MIAEIEDVYCNLIIGKRLLRKPVRIPSTGRKCWLKAMWLMACHGRG